MEINEGKCQAWVHQTSFYGKAGDVRCQKIAVCTDVHGRHLCQNHYNRWLKKAMKGQINFKNRITTTLTPK